MRTSSVAQVRPRALVAVLAALSACVGPSGTDTGTEDATTGDDTDDQCSMTESLEHSVSFTSANPLDDGTFDCDVVTAAVAEGTLTIDLDCPTAQPGATSVTIVAPAEVVPSGLAPGTQLVFRLLDGVEIGDPELEFELRDDQGPIVAMAEYAYGVAEWPPLLLKYDTYCEVDPQGSLPGGTNNGFVQVELGSETFDVMPGTPEIVTSDGVEWEIFALVAAFACCESPSISVELVRRN